MLKIERLIDEYYLIIQVFCVSLVLRGLLIYFNFKFFGLLLQLLISLFESPYLGIMLS